MTACPLHKVPQQKCPLKSRPPQSERLPPTGHLSPEPPALQQRSSGSGRGGQGVRMQELPLSPQLWPADACWVRLQVEAGGGRRYWWCCVNKVVDVLKRWHQRNMPLPTSKTIRCHINSKRDPLGWCLTDLLGREGGVCGGSEALTFRLKRNRLLDPQTGGYYFLFLAR